MESQRLFVALELPDGVRDDLRSAVEPRRADLPGVRWVPPENWHVTLVFLGATSADRVSGVGARLQDALAGVVAFDTVLTTFGGFPSQARARVLWAGLEDRAGRIGELARTVREALGAEPQDRPFAAHVTVARSATPLRLPEGFTAAAVPSTPFTVKELILFRSHLARPAPRYEPLAGFPFGEGVT